MGEERAGLGLGGVAVVVAAEVAEESCGGVGYGARRGAAAQLGSTRYLARGGACEPEELQPSVLLVAVAWAKPEPEAEAERDPRELLLVVMAAREPDAFSVSVEREPDPQAVLRGACRQG